MRRAFPTPARRGHGCFLRLPSLLPLAITFAMIAVPVQARQQSARAAATASATIAAPVRADAAAFAEPPHAAIDIPERADRTISVRRCPDGDAAPAGCRMMLVEMI